MLKKKQANFAEEEDVCISALLSSEEENKRAKMV